MKWMKEHIITQGLYTCDMKPDKPMITEKLLIDSGYIPQTFFYQIGGGEDENDMKIFVKDDFAISFDWTRKKWRMAKRSQLNYINGWPEQNQEWIDYDNL